jgi:hypothetical protein
MAKKNIPVPSKEEFNFKSIKRLNNGGAYIEYSHLFSCGNEVHTYEGKPTITLNVHDDLLRLLNKQAGNILLMDGVKYRLLATTFEKMDGDNQSEVDKVKQIAEGLFQDAMRKVTVTGVSISGKDGNKKVCIKYTHLDENKKIIGRSTSPILLSGNDLGFEEELEADITEIKDEVYEYLFGSKHGDSEQQEIDFDVETGEGE